MAKYCKKLIPIFFLMWLAAGIVLSSKIGVFLAFMGGQFYVMAANKYWRPGNED